jgi:histone deacetylase 1/2
MCIFVLINVDDIIVVSNADTAIDTLISNLGFEFAIKYLGELSYFLGIHVTKTENGLHLHQGKYVFDLLHHMKMTDAKPTPTPCISGAKLSKFSGDPLIDPTAYRSMVGAFQYLTLTRPNISYSVNQLCQFLHFPTNIHLTVAKRVLRYLKGTLQFGLQFNKGSLQLNGFCDSDWAGNPDDQKYTSGYCIYLGSCLISWTSKK